MAGLPMFVKDSPVINRAYGVYDPAVDSTGKVLFTLPKGAMVSPGSFVIVETGDGATGAAILIGTASNTDALFAAGDITEATAATYAMVLATLNDDLGKAPLAADTDIIATYSKSSGTSTGKYHVVVNFAHSNDPTTIG